LLRDRPPGDSDQGRGDRVPLASDPPAGWPRRPRFRGGDPPVPEAHRLSGEDSRTLPGYGTGAMTTRDLTAIALFAATTVVCAQASVAVPVVSSVPFTLQVFAVLASGAILGARRGFLSQVVYLLLGAAGVPVFARWHGGAQVL